MKTKCILGIKCILLLLLFSGTSLFAQTENLKDQNCKRINELIRMLELYHYKPVLLNDISFKEISTQFFHKVDPNRLFFTSDDLSFLEKYDRIPHTEFNQFLCDYFQDVSTSYNNGLHRAEFMIDEMLEINFDFTKEETLDKSANDSLNFVKNTIDLKDQWRKYLKYRILGNISYQNDSLKTDENSDLSYLLKDINSIKEKVKDLEKKKIKRKLGDQNQFNERLLSLYLNTIANRYDPHTAYFSGNEIERFQSSLSRDTYSFGFSIKENKNGQIELSNLVPGSSAWRSNQLHKGDIILEAKTSDDKVYSFLYSDIFEAEDILRNLVGNKINLKVKKKSGETVLVKLAKEKITNEDNKIGSLLLKSDKNIGYMSLPSFYTEWENSDNLGCANDFAKELIKLNRENIDGLILDLRNNSGGSMKEAIEMAGIFIDYGPVSVTKQRDKKPVLLRDMNRGTIYNGPLVIMVNSLSASASELLAAALQDYNRAIIVGSPTFGKASGQKLMPFFETGIGDDVSLDDLKDNIGVIKVTNFNFYRILGTSHQKTGVIPDINLPDIFDDFNFREGSYPFSFEKSTIVKKLYYKLLPELPKDELQTKSQKRVESSDYFSNLKKLNKDFLAIANQKEKPAPLDLKSYLEEEKKSFSFFNNLSKINKSESSLFTIQPPSYDADLIQIDKYSKELSDNLKSKLLKDKQLEEAFQIINDYILIKE